MIKLKFNNDDKFYDIEFRKIEPHIVKVFGDIPQNTSGFVLYNEDGIEFLGNWSSYITIYKIENDGILFSNNGLVYIPDPSELPDAPKNQSVAVIFDYNFWDLVEIPDSVTINYLVDNEEFEIELTKEKNWEDIITIKNSQTLTVNGFEELENFSAKIYENSVIYQWIGAVNSEIMPTDDEL